MGKARIKLIGKTPEELEEVCKQIVEIAKATGVEIKGPVPLPTHRMTITTRRTPCGDGSDTYEKWELRVHKRLIEIKADDRVLRDIMRIRIPQSVHVEMHLN